MKSPLLSLGKRRLACALVATLASQAAQAAPLPGLVHHWNFDEGPDWHDSAFQAVYAGTTAYNFGASMPAATLKNMAAANWVSGRQFTALSFNGTNQYVDAGTNLATALGGTSSLSCWIRTSQLGPSASTNAPGIAGSSASGGVQFGWIDNTGRIALSVGNVLVVRSAKPVNDNLWHHVVLTRNATTGAAQIYVDGTLSASATGATGVKATAFTSLGRIANGAAATYFQGRLDQVTIFNTVIAAGTVTTLNTNHAPKAWDTTTDGVNNAPFITKSVFATCYDVERQTLAVDSFTQPAHGSVAHNGDGSFTFTATPGYLGKDSFAVAIEDGNGGYHRVTMNVNIATEPVGGGVPLLTYGGFTQLQTNGGSFDKSGMRVPRAVDWDGDGKLDLLLGVGGSVWIYLNTGTVNAPAFGVPTQVKANGVNISAGNSTSPITLADMTGDGVKDLVMSDSASKLRIYRNTAVAGATPVYAAATFVKNTSNADLVISDRRFDIGDWDGDGLLDIVTGTFSGNLLLYTNTGTASAPRYGTTGTVLFGGSYNLYPRLHDLNGNGSMDLLWGINWGEVSYWRDVMVNAKDSTSSDFAISLTDGTTADVRAPTDGAVVDIADLNGDGTPDMIFGGHAGAQILVAYGAPKTIAQSIAVIEAIYDANPSPADLGGALSANSNALLNQINSANLNLISYITSGTPAARKAVYDALAAHIAKYPFLKYQTLDTTKYHHVPSIVLQNWVMLGYAKPDTPTHRTAVADIMNLTGTMRTIYLENRLALGDNAKSIPAAYGTIRDFQRRHPRELFPDAVITIDQLNKDERGGFKWTPNSTKNTFADSSIYSNNEWAGDLTSAIEGVLGSDKASGDYFTFVMGHEVSHSLDNYVNTRANQDLRRRWGLSLVTAAGPDVIAGADGWRDVAATKANFQAKGLWDGVEANWATAWKAYWTTGPGSVFRDTAFMRGGIDWFLDSTQESLATQGNHHWANGPGRLIGAVDRFRRSSAAGAAPMKANINEVVTFIDFLSAGMNRVNLVETKYQASPKQVNWFDHYADLERDDNGRVTKVSVDGYVYDLVVNADGVVTDVDCSIATLVNDSTTAVSGTAKTINVGANDTRLDGKPLVVHSFTQPANGQVTAGAAGQLIYRSNAGFTGSNTFTYKVGLKTATVSVTVSAATSSVFDRWLQTNGLLAGGNPDGDALTNLMEYAFGTDPNVKNPEPITTDGTVILSSGLPKLLKTGSGPAKVLFARHLSPQLAGLTYTPQFSSNLKDWFNSAGTITSEAQNDGIEIVSTPFPATLPDSSVPRFFRMKIATY